MDDFILKKSSVLSSLYDLYSFSKMWTKHYFENKNVQKLINSTDLQFDVIVLEEFVIDSFLMFGHKFQAPIVAINPMGATDFLDQQMGFLTPLSFVPNHLLHYSDIMTFSERWYNVFVSSYDWILRRFIYLPSEQAFAQKYFGHLGPLPSIDDLHRNTSLYLINTHRFF